MQTVTESIYDHPRYYDLVFGSDCAAEVKFINAINDRFLDGNAKQLFEPACGTGRLIQWLAKRDFSVEGIDLNDKAIDFANKRFAKHDLPQAAWVADMADFVPKKKYDLAFNTINSFRHLLKPKTATAHLSCMAAGAKKNAVYLIGLHLNPTEAEMVDEESWSARRGHLSIVSHMWTNNRDSKKRLDRFGVRFDIYTPTKQFSISDELVMRSYTDQQFIRMIEMEGSWDIEATFDFTYRIDHPIEIDATSEDVVFVLRKK